MKTIEFLLIYHVINWFNVYYDRPEAAQSIPSSQPDHLEATFHWWLVDAQLQARGCRVMAAVGSWQSIKLRPGGSAGPGSAVWNQTNELLIRCGPAEAAWLIAAFTVRTFCSLIFGGTQEIFSVGFIMWRKQKVSNSHWTCADQLSLILKHFRGELTAY